MLNHKQGLMTSKKLRQAFQAALDMQPIMAAAVGHPLFYRLDPALFPPELVLWHSTAGGAAYNARAALHPLLQCNSPGWWCLEEKERLLGELVRETDVRKRKAIIDRIQVLFYEDVGHIKFGDLFSLDVMRKEIRGDLRSFPAAIYFWNAWLEEK